MTRAATLRTATFAAASGLLVLSGGALHQPAPERPLGTVAGAPDGFQPAAASFISTSHGWVLEARVPTASRCSLCLELGETDDGGRSWSFLPAPPARFSWGPASPPSANAVSEVSFANASDGYLFGPGLLVTDDGGRSWTAPPLPGADSLVLVGGDAYVLDTAVSGRPDELWRAPVGSAHWVRVALHNRTPGELDAQGRTLVLLQAGFTGVEAPPDELGRLWSSSDGGTSWHADAVPCTVNDGGAALVAIALGQPRRWLLDCYDNLQSSQQMDTQHHLYQTLDAGKHWTRLADPAHRGEPLSLADNGAGGAFLGTASAQDSLFGTLNGGRSWHLVFDDGGDFYGFAGPSFVNGAFGYVVAPTHYVPTHLYLTTDGGRSWRITSVG